MNEHGVALRLEHVSYRYGATTALDGVDVEVGADELLVVLGPTGAGKTTLLRVIAGLEQPTRGRITIDGQDVTEWSPAHRDVAFVFQDFSLYPGWSVRRNLVFPLRAPGRSNRLSPSQVEERVRWAAALLRIEALLDRPAETLSGGEMQRVAIGRAIVRRPRLFLMDEPLTNLDAKLREALRVELVLLRRELGIPMVYVTHDQAEALSMGDRIAVLSAGRVLQTGTPEDVYVRPDTPQIARQLGQPAINLIPVCRRKGRWWTEGAAPVPLPTPDRPIAAETAWLGVRPEAVLPEGGGPAGTVTVVQDTGPALVLVVEWAGQILHILTHKGHSWAQGDRVRPLILADRALLWPRCCLTAG